MKYISQFILKLIHFRDATLEINFKHKTEIETSTTTNILFIRILLLLLN